MSAENSPAAPPVRNTRNPDRYSGAGLTPDPWVECARLAYGGDRSHASIVRAEVISTPAARRAGIEDRLLKALATPGRTDAGLAFICQMLALVGTARIVPALAPLLRDAKSVEAARYALEPIPGPEADAALREALGALAGAAKAGVIGSIGVRGDAAARPTLAALRDTAGEPAIVREAAGRALAQLDHSKG
jgi:hypothetical protein